MRKATVYVLTAALLTGILFVGNPAAIESAEASPYQSYAGEDYVNVSATNGAAIRAAAGRTTATTYDGWDTIYDNLTYEITFDNDKLTAEGYNSTNVTITDDTLSVTNEYTDDFNDNSIGAEWTVKQSAPATTIYETNQSLYTYYSGAGFGQTSFIHQTTTSNFNASVRSQTNLTLLDRPGQQLVIFHDGASITAGNTGEANLKYAKCSITHLGADTNLAVIFHYRNTTNTNLYYNSATSTWTTSINNAFTISPLVQYNHSIEFNDTHAIYYFEGDASNLKASVELAEVNESASSNHVAIGTSIHFSTVKSLVGRMDRFNLKYEPSEANYTSPAIPCGANNSVFQRLIWDGNTTEVTVHMRTANNEAMTGASGWHAVENNTNYVSTAWAGSWMQFRFVFDDMNAAVSNIRFQHYGSSYGIPFNGSLSEIIIDRDTRWYGQNQSWSGYINISDDLGTGVAINFTLQNCSIQVNNQTFRALDPCNIYVHNTSFIDVPVTSTEILFILASNGANYYAYNLYTNGVNAFLQQTAADDDTYCEIKYSEFYVDEGGQPFINASFSGNVSYCYLHGGHNETVAGAPFDVFFGIFIVNAHYNHFDLYYGGAAIATYTAKEYTTDTTATRISNNFIDSATVYGIGVFCDWTTNKSVVNGTHRVANNIIVNGSSTNIITATGITSVGASNWTFINNYIYNANYSQRVTAGILITGALDSDDGNVSLRSAPYMEVSDNFIWNVQAGAAIAYLAASDLTITGNFIYNISRNFYGEFYFFSNGGWGIVVAHSPDGTNYGNDNTIINVYWDSYILTNTTITLGNDTHLGSNWYSHWLIENVTLNVWGGNIDILTNPFVKEDTTSNYTFHQLTSFNLLQYTVGEGTTQGTFSLTATTAGGTTRTITNANGARSVYLETFRSWAGTMLEVDPEYEVTLTSSGANYNNMYVEENGVVIPNTVGSVIFTATADNTYVIYEERTYQNVIDELDSIFDLYGDLGTLLGLNLGGMLFFAINIALFAGVLLILGGVAGFVANQIAKIRGGGKRR